ncbi:F-box/WD repeat-containing protein 5 isoform X1 [Glossina fuscipes]|uniref:F-box/WD repeat-containing protein 5 isoform X1 n=1 Tax=Glossina fuscipes TaxID=7396 RepID=A0A9C6E200_9MUSC|nr:F-box/WD repeat-containing protein 5 isoform X1 [Glossina fuscipes]
MDPMGSAAAANIPKKPKIYVSKSESDNAHVKDDYDDDAEDLWWTLPQLVLTEIFWLLPVKDILNAGLTCRRWYEIANDDYLWKRKFHRHFKTDPCIALKPGAVSWKSEYERLTFGIPFVQSQCLKGHVHQVLHVSFSHNGEMFSTCSKDGYVIIWNAGHPCTEKYSQNMKKFNWKYTQYSQFNQSDSLLLVSGVHFGSPHSTSGEIAVFTVDGNVESHLRCRVINRPYDIFGTWFSDQYLISGDLHWLAQMVSTSILWLNKANQEVDSEHVPIMNQLYKFYNRNASSVRAIMMAKCPWLDESNDPLITASTSDEILESPSDDIEMSEHSLTVQNSVGNPLSHSASLRRAFHISFDDSTPSTSTASLSLNWSLQRSNDSTIHYLDEYRREFTGDSVSDESVDEEEDEPMDASDEYDEMENSIPKYLIFSTGSKTYTPHQIGIKRIRNITFPKKLDPGPSLKERIAAKKAAEQQNQFRDPDPDWWDYEAVADRFDKVDKVIDLHGHIIGMALSPDHRYLYVNTRPWPKNYIITNPLEPPPIAQEIDIHVIDLMTLKRIGNMLRAHKAYTPSTECFFIFLDVCDDYVASGAEDMHAYLWDRYYGISLAKYKHTDVVNSVAFNPKDNEMLVTTSDDFTIKVILKVLPGISGNTHLTVANERVLKRCHFSLYFFMKIIF